MDNLQILKEIHPFIKEGNWFTSESLNKNRKFNDKTIGHKVFSRLSANLILLYQNGYLERKNRNEIIFNKTRRVSYRGKYVYKLKTKYQSLPQNQLKLKL